MAAAEEIPTVPLPQEEPQDSNSPRAFLPAQSPPNLQDMNSKEQILQKQTATGYKPKGSPPLTKFDIDEHTVIRTLNDLQEHQPESSIRRSRRSLALETIRLSRLSIGPAPRNTQDCKWPPLPPLSPSINTPPIPRPGTRRAPTGPDESSPQLAAILCNFMPDINSGFIPRDLLAERSPSTLRTSRLPANPRNTIPNSFSLVNPNPNSFFRMNTLCDDAEFLIPNPIFSMTSS